jgi:uncharacterized protein
MTIRTSPWPAGVPCWLDLATDNVDAAQQFYTAVMGWSFPVLDEDYGGYVIAQVKGQAAAGIGPMQGGQERPTWTLYLASDNAEDTEAAVREHGGAVLSPTGDVGPLGRMCIAADPSGAVFGIWQAINHIGASLVNEPGGLTWEDLRSTDPAAAQSFYGGVFGYEFHELPMAGADYSTFHLSGDPAPLGGMGGMMGAAEGTPSHWLVYLSVADADAAVATVEAHGGSVVAPAFDSPFGRMAVVADPAGAVFYLAQIAPDQTQPDRAG